MDARERLSKARTQLLLNKKYVFWATIGLYQKPIENKHLQFKTMATDGKHLYYDPDFVMSLDNEALMGVLAHEAGHCALGHHFRRQERNPIAWNVACDLALNPLLMDSGLKLPAKSLYDKKLVGKCAEEIYSTIKITEIPAGFCIGEVLDAPKDQEGEKQWEVIIRQAASIAKGQGYLPGGFEHLLKPITPKIDLHTLLKHMFSIIKDDDYTWAKPSRKHVWQGMYLPSCRTETTGDILVAVDVSGSVSDEQAARFLGVVNVVLSDLKPRIVHLIQCDAAVQKHDEFRNGESLPEHLGVKGRGGTDMRPIWEYVKEKQLNPACAVVCSDFLMDEASFGEKQDFAVMWVTCSKDLEAPWGQTARLDYVE